MIRVLSESEPKANKNHDCMASEFILAAGINGYGYSFTELRSIAKAKNQNYKIIKGQKYIRQSNTFEGEIYTFKAIPEMHEICLEHGHYEI